VLGMKTLILIVAVTITAAAVPFGVMFGHTKPDREPADIPSELLAALQKDLNEDKDVKGMFRGARQSAVGRTGCCFVA
jgi:hypothetical protein